MASILSPDTFAFLRDRAVSTDRTALLARLDDELQQRARVQRELNAALSNVDSVHREALLAQSALSVAAEQAKYDVCALCILCMTTAV